MTHSGGKPHAVGDRGQRYEVTYFDPRENVREVFGWSDDAEGARAMADSIDAHPVWQFPQVLDRNVTLELVAAAPALLALVKQYASECGECNGTGVIEIEKTRAVPACCGRPTGDGSCCGNPLPAPEPYLDADPCPDCADIRAVIAKAEPPR